MVIDIHAHVVPELFMDAVAQRGAELGVGFVTGADGFTRFQINGVTGARYEPSFSDRTRRLAFMDAEGIDVQVLSPWIDLTGYDVDAARGEAYCSMLNEAMSAEMATDPGRFRAAGSVPLQAGGEVAARVLRRAITELGLSGVQIASRIPGMELSDPSLFPFWEEAERLSALVLMHPHHTLQLRPTVMPALEFVINNPADTTLAIAQLLFTGALQKFPNVKLCLPHGGGFVPWQVGRMDSAWRRMNPGARTEDSPSAQLGRMYFDTIIHGSDALEFLEEAVGSDRILLGTDNPFELGDLHPLATLQQSVLAEPPHWDRVTGANARTLLDGVTHRPAA